MVEREERVRSEDKCEKAYEFTHGSQVSHDQADHLFVVPAHRTHQCGDDGEQQNVL